MLKFLFRGTNYEDAGRSREAGEYTRHIDMAQTASKVVELQTKMRSRIPDERCHKRGAFWMRHHFLAEGRVQTNARTCHTVRSPEQWEERVVHSIKQERAQNM